jgi:hypothetical protein
LSKWIFCFVTLNVGLILAFFSRYLYLSRSTILFDIYDTFFSCRLDQLAKLKRDYPFPIPDRCPCCQGRIWKHGFTTAYFHPFSDPLYIRLLRCPDCGTVFRLKPTGYLPRFSFSLVEIFLFLFVRKAYPHPEAPINPQTRRSWLKRLKRQIKVTLADLKSKDYKAGFLRLLQQGFSPVSSAMSLRIPPGFTFSTEMPPYTQ